ncbi:MAG: low molecular weight phosphotyrosine protein phosphatase [Muribaculaceae bacterium]|nr:low molecular weight phosphotyrosine protein phosphatase [Muribaculaceae bacterium]
MSNPKTDFNPVDALRDKISAGEHAAILFVCLGNICRSPAAEEVMRSQLAERGLDKLVALDSAGLYAGHRGELPDPRMRAHAQRRGYTLTHRSRPVKTSDFEDFDLIVGMDHSNLSRLRAFAPTDEDELKVVGMIDFCRAYTHFDHVPDPYYEGAEGFEIVLDLLEDACHGLADRIAPQSN